MRARPPTPQSRTRRRVEHAYSYGLPLRFADGRAGRRDAGIDWSVFGAPAFLQRLTATCRENGSRLFARTADRLRPTVKDLHHQFDELRRLRYEIGVAEAQVAARPEPALTAVGGAERHMPADAIAARRQREDDVARASATAHVDQLRAERAQARAACGRLRAEIAEEFELAREQSERLHWYYERRGATYLRALLRRRGANPTGAPVPEWHLPAAPWTTQPCPWIPVGLDEAFTEKEA